MISLDYSCDNCIHKRKNIDGWKCACDAFPEGIPNDIILRTDVTKLEECNDGIKFETE